MRMSLIALMTSTALMAGCATVPEADPAWAQVGNDVSGPVQTLTLSNIPEPAGATVTLFNGADLNMWEEWQGYADPGQTYTMNHAPGQGRVASDAPHRMFSVVTLEGQPALRVDGRTWGSLVHTGDYADYHLRLEYKWSGVRHAPRLELPENNGLLYHSHGAHGAVWGTWMKAVEFEIMTGSTGMVVPVGNGLEVTTTAVRDEALIDPMLRFRLGGAEAKAVGGTAIWNIENARDVEKPVGEWNTVDLYVVGNRAVHVLNGVPVMVVWNMCDPKTEGGACEPLTHGRIQLQSEGAETFFRNMTLTPIKHLPSVK